MRDCTRKPAQRPSGRQESPSDDVFWDVMLERLEKMLDDMEDA